MNKYEQAKQLQEDLKDLGYDAQIVNGTCFDIHQKEKVHYLGFSEADQLSRTTLVHPVNLAQYARRLGANYWYYFPAYIRRQEK